MIREAQPRDLEGLYALSEHLDSVNFPHDRKVLRSVTKKARDSFLGRIDDVSRRQYMFVLETREGEIAGTSMIYAQHGHVDAPHVFFDVYQEERYSSTLDRHFRHTTLRLGLNYEGPTEIGALVIHPDHRATGLGKPLSFIRFLFVAMFRSMFRDEIIAELMPPLTEEGQSLLWDHVGARFTGLTYQEADKLSHTNKEFIISLFPQAIHATLLPDHVAALIGEVGAETQGVRKMLQQVGFRYYRRIDPFDGGPHFHAATDDISIIRNARAFRVARAYLRESEEGRILAREKVRGLDRYLVASARPEPPLKFRATLAAAAEEENDEIVLSPETVQLLGLRPGAHVWATKMI